VVVLGGSKRQQGTVNVTSTNPCDNVRRCSNDPANR
jgi:hypothetical protein